MRKLVHYSPKMMSILLSRGGAAKLRIQQLHQVLLENNSAETRREVTIRGLMLYLREDETELLKEEDGEGDITGEVMKIVTTAAGTPPSSAKMVLEGMEVLPDVDVPTACALLMGLIYALNLSYPKQLKSTFEVFQKILLELDHLKTSPKVMALVGEAKLF